MGTEGSPEAAARLRESMGLDRPLVVQYVDWLTRALRGDLGVSIQYDVPVGTLIVSRLPVTLPLTALAAVFMIAKDYLSGLNPVYWEFWLGILLIVVVMVGHGGILGRLEALWIHLRTRT